MSATKSIIRRHANGVSIFKATEANHGRTPASIGHSTGNRQGLGKAAARSLRRSLLGIDLTTLTAAQPLAITLTMNATPKSGDDLKVIRRKIDRRIKALGVTNVAWVIEFTKKARPHLHMLADYNGQKPDAEKIATEWAKILRPYGLHADASYQSITDAYDVRGWLSYMAKMASDSARFNQHVPSTWKSTPKMWGNSFPVLNAVDVHVDDDTWMAAKDVIDAHRELATGQELPRFNDVRDEYLGRTSFDTSWDDLEDNLGALGEVPDASFITLVLTRNTIQKTPEVTEAFGEAIFPSISTTPTEEKVSIDGQKEAKSQKDTELAQSTTHTTGTNTMTTTDGATYTLTEPQHEDEDAAYWYDLLDAPLIDLVATDGNDAIDTALEDLTAAREAAAHDLDLEDALADDYLNGDDALDDLMDEDATAHVHQATKEVTTVTTMTKAEQEQEEQEEEDLDEALADTTVPQLTWSRGFWDLADEADFW